MNTSTRRLSALALGMALCAGLVLAAMAPGRKVTQPDREKSKYHYLAGARLFGTDSLDEAYEFMRRSHSTDPGNIESGYSFGLLDFGITPDSLRSVADAALMRRYIETYPDDLYEGSAYASLNVKYLQDYKEAARVYEQLLKRFPSHTDLYYDLAQAYMGMDSVEGAVEAIRRHEVAEGADDRSTLTKAYIYLSQGDTAKVTEMADIYAARNPLKAGAWGLRGNIYGMLNMKDSALSSLLQAERLAPDSFEPKAALADFYQYAGDSVTADLKLTEAMATNDVSVDEKSEGIGALGQRILAAGGDLRRLLPMIDTLLRQEPANLPVLMMKRDVYTATSQFDKAIEIMRHALEINPDDPLVWEGLLSTMLFNKDYKGVAQAYGEASSRLSGGTTARMRLMLSTAYSLDNDYDNSIRVIREEVEKVLPEYKVTLPADSVTRLAALRLVAAQHKPVANWLQMLGDQYVAKKDTATGMTIYEQTLALDPDNILALNNFAYYLALQDKDLPRAEKMSLRTIEAEPDNATYLDTFAYILFREGDYRRAATYQKMAIDNMGDDEGHGDIYDHYGDILFKAGEKEEALKYWKKALELDPDNQLLKRKISDETYYEK